MQKGNRRGVESQSRENLDYENQKEEEKKQNLKQAAKITFEDVKFTITEKNKKPNRKA